MDTETKIQEVKIQEEEIACEYKATLGKDGHLKIEANSEECFKAGIGAAAEAVDFIRVKPKAVTGDKPKSV